eukprot:scaffold196579_cov30-Prasinocladus_malaysianus.AAC.1
MALTKFSASLGGGKSLMDFLKFGAWKGLIDGNIGSWHGAKALPSCDDNYSLLAHSSSACQSVSWQTLFVHGPKANCVGEDEHGNKYFESKSLQQGRHRFVVYKDLDNKDPTMVPPQWHMTTARIRRAPEALGTELYQSNQVSGVGKWARPKFSPAIHPPNHSDTPLKYQPKGSYLNPQRRSWKKMEYWSPN